MKKLITILLIVALTSCGISIEIPISNLEPPKNNTDYKNIIGNPVKIDKFEVAEYDFPRDMNWYDAEKACEAIGDDWRLPSKDELKILYRNRDKIGGFTNVNYWSSTDADSYYDAWLQHFFNGVQNSTNKSDEYYVRAIRVF
jgi:hypothetical protein